MAKKRFEREDNQIIIHTDQPSDRSLLPLVHAIDTFASHTLQYTSSFSFTSASKSSAYTYTPQRFKTYFRPLRKPVKLEAPAARSRPVATPPPVRPPR